MKTQTNKAIGMAIKEFRVRRGYSQEALADRAGLDRSYISLVERGMRSPSFDTLLCFAAGLSMQLSVIVSRAETLLAAMTSNEHDIST